MSSIGTSNITAFFLPGSHAVPEVGMGATLILWSDTHAYTISRVSKSGKSFWMKRDHAIRTDTNGMSDCQDYRYEPDPDAAEEPVRMTKRGWMSNGSLVRVGVREEYFDYSF